MEACTKSIEIDPKKDSTTESLSNKMDQGIKKVIVGANTLISMTLNTSYAFQTPPKASSSIP